MGKQENRPFWQFKAQAAREGALFLYGEISDTSWWGDEVTPAQFQKELAALGDIDTLHVYVNSGGGDVFAGWAIISMLDRHPARTVGHNDGLAASIAFDILVSLDEVHAAENCLFMTHNCWTWARGSREDLLRIAARMEKIDETRAETTARRTGKAVEEVRAWQDAETWFTAREAQEAGLVAHVEAREKVAASIEGGVLCMGEGRFDLSRYKRPLGMEPGDFAALCEGLDKAARLEAQERAMTEPARETGGQGTGHAHTLSHIHPGRGQDEPGAGHAHTLSHIHPGRGQDEPGEGVSRTDGPAVLGAWTSVAFAGDPAGVGAAIRPAGTGAMGEAAAAVIAEAAMKEQRAEFSRLRLKLIGG